MAIFSGTFYVNSVFVWPKLLAGSLVVLAYVLLLGKQRPSVAATTLASASAGLALLAHAGVIFTLIPLAAIVVARRTRPAPSAVLAGAAALVVLLAPWSAYKLFYEPPGNQLAKMHLAGVEDFDDTRSLAQAMSGVYGSASLAELAGNRVSNVLTLVGGWPRWPAPSTTGDELTPLRQQEFLHPVRALGLLNLAWLGLAAGLAWFGLAGGRVGQGARYWRRRSLPAGSDESGRATRLMLAVAGLSIVVWVVLMFQPHRAVMHQGSFATVILLFVALAGIIGSWPPVWSVALVTVQVAWFTYRLGGSGPARRPASRSRLGGARPDRRCPVRRPPRPCRVVWASARRLAGTGRSPPSPIDSPADPPPEATVRPSPPRSHRRRDARRGPGRSAPPPVPGPR